MKFNIKHEINGRIRFGLSGKYMTARQADVLLHYLQSVPGVTKAKVYERTADAVVCFREDRGTVIDAVKKFSYDDEEIKDMVPGYTGRELNNLYQERLVDKVVLRMASKLFFPYPLKMLIAVIKSIKFIRRGIHCLSKRRMEVEVLDAAAITVSIIRADFDTAGSIMFLLGIGELLEEWTHKKSVADLAGSMSLNIEKAWLRQGEADVLVPISKIKEGDMVIVHMGNIIPFDGIVVSGEAMVNQASLTGESMPVKKEQDAFVYAGTVVEEGEIVLGVKNVAGNTRFERIITMIEESEKLKSSLEGKAEHLADKLVPYSFLGTILTYLFTRNITKALSILMVDFSCALKLSIPIAVLSAMREAGTYQITVKGGKYLEAVAKADVIVFDKTGTLTKAKPVVADIITFSGKEKDEMLRIAACLEEHFPHSMAAAVVNEANKKNLVHKEIHTKVNYIVAHGISTTINGEKVIIGSSHFVFEDEQTVVPENELDKFNKLPNEFSHLYLAINGELAAVICIEDPLRKEAGDVIAALKQSGIGKVVMMTGDSERTAKNVADKIAVDEYYSEVLPEDKAVYIKSEKKHGRIVIMVGDGINDSPALSAADAGIAIREGAGIAREIADITISADNLYEIITLKLISNELMKRIDKNYRFVIGFNLGLIIFGINGLITPSTSALFHNASTLGISLKSMSNLLY